MSHCPGCRVCPMARSFPVTLRNISSKKGFIHFPFRFPRMREVTASHARDCANNQASDLIQYDSKMLLNTIERRLDDHTDGDSSIEHYNMALSTEEPTVHVANMMEYLKGGQHYVPRFLCSPVPMFPEPMFPGTYVPRYRCSPIIVL